MSLAISMKLPYFKPCEIQVTIHDVPTWYVNRTSLRPPQPSVFSRAGELSISQGALSVICNWEDNCRFSIASAMHHMA